METPAAHTGEVLYQITQDISDASWETCGTLEEASSNNEPIQGNSRELPSDAPPRSRGVALLEGSDDVTQFFQEKETLEAAACPIQISPIRSNEEG